MRPVFVLTMVVAVVVGLVSAPAAAEPGDRLDWGPCPFDVGASGARCATVAVPLDYRNPTGRTLDIHVSRVPAGDPARRRGTLVMNQGGPSVHLADAAGFAGLAPELTEFYDVVSFDQRGFGHSAPVRCGLRPEQQTIFPWPLPGGEPAVRANAKSVAERCAERAGAELPYLGTKNVARDVDRIRQALGERRISFYGASYGTLLGAAYDSMFPHRVDLLLLDSNVDPASAWRDTFRQSLTVGVEVRFADFADFAAAHQGSYGLGGDRAAVRRTFLDLVGRLDRDPLATPRGELAGVGLRVGMFGGLYRDAAFPTLADLLVAARDRDAAAAGKAGTDLSVWWDDDNISSGQYAVFCADGRFPRAPGPYAEQAEADAAAYPLTGGAGAAIWPCAFWPSDPVDPPVRVSRRGRPNVLLMNNLRDPGTTYAAARALRRQFGERARLVGIDHGGHGGFLFAGNPCADRVGTDFLVRGARPVADFVCPAGHAGLRAALERLTAVHGAPGALAEVRDARGTVVLSSGVADRATGRPLTAGDRVRVYSNTKTFVATVLLQLHAEGRVALDEPVETYLPGVIRANGNDGRRITVRHLLQHTSGLPDFDSAVFAPGGYHRHRFDHHEPVELIDAALERPPLSAPGAEFHYSTTNYVAAGMIVERVTGRDYADEVRDRILRPLGLRDTIVPGDRPTVPGRHARGYAYLDENDQLADHGRLVDVTLLNPSLVWAGGEMVSTVTDLTTFFAALLDGRLLPAAQLAEMRRTVPADLFPGSRYGLGLISVPLSCGGEYWSHGGTGIGYQTRQGHTLDGRHVSVVHTSSPPGPALAADTAAAVDTALCEAVPARHPR